MQIDTYLFGKIDVSEQALIDFPDGVPGFEQCKRFALIHEAATSSPTSFTLQSIDDAQVAFQITDPTSYGFHYELQLSDEETAKLKVTAPTDLAVMLILFRREDKSGPIEASVWAPLIINTVTRIGIQKVIDRVQPNITLSNLARNV
jgi:flagellar assembly factor FliW